MLGLKAFDGMQLGRHVRGLCNIKAFTLALRPGSALGLHNP